MTTLIHHDGALGDVLLSLACIHALAREGRMLHFTGRADIGTLLQEAGLVQEASSSSAALFASLHGGTADGAEREFLRRFDAAVVFTVNPGSVLVTAVRRELPDTRVITTVPPDGSAIPAADFRLGQLAPAGPTVPGPLLPVPPLHRQLAAGMLGRSGYDGSAPLLVVHPGSGGRPKCWPLDRYLELLDTVHERPGPFIALFTGPAEEGETQDRIDAFTRDRTGMVHYAGADLSALAAVLSSADLYLGNDSGVTHLAAAAGCRVIALFGPSDPAIWAPRGPDTVVLRSPDLAALSVPVVAAAVQEALARPGKGSP